jgi:hypothetical protein
MMGKHLWACFFLLWGSISNTSAQREPWAKRLQAGLSPGINYRLITQVNPNIWETHTEKNLADSFRSNDVSQQAFGGFVGVVFQRERRSAIAVNLVYQHMGFIRRKEGRMFGYQPHPDLNVYSQLVDGPTQVLDYHFIQRFLAIEMSYLRRLDGVNLVLPQTELYAWISVSPAVNVMDKVQLRARGFSLAEGKEVDVYDYTLEPDALGGAQVRRVQNPSMSLFFSAGLRAEYALEEKLKILAQPRIDISAVPNFQGVQRAHSYRMAIDLGLVYVL